MSKICSKCKRIMDYDPYFKLYICRQCGYDSVAKKTVVRVKNKIAESLELSALPQK